ncbi:hypothetical protein Hanom_Chr06g00501971 [Helianthus anomalus]
MGVFRASLLLKSKFHKINTRALLRYCLFFARSTSEPLMSAPCRPRADIRVCSLFVF